MAGAEIKVTGNLANILADLEALKKKAGEVQDALKQGGGEVTEQLTKNRRKNETFFESIRSMGARTADQLRRDFKALISLESLQGALKISSQFKNTISETVALSDAIRKLGHTFGMTEKNFASFQTYLTQGLGELGLSSEVAVKTLEALAKTPVRSQQGVLEYSKTAGMLASIGNERGKEGDIAGGLAGVIKARGGNVEDMNQVRELAEAVRKITIQTGVSPSQVLANMESLFAKMPEDLRKAISPEGMANLAAAQAVGGPGAIKFLEEYLGKSPIARKAFEEQGGKGVFTDKGIDTAKFAEFAKSILARVKGDKRLAAQTLGLSEEAAEGFVRLAESLDEVAAAQDKIKATTGSLTESYRASMGMQEAFEANLNKVKGTLSGFLEPITQGLTGVLSDATESEAGSTAVVAGGAILAAILAGGGLRGILGTVTKGTAAKALTGKDVQPVYVVNASEIGGGGMGGPGGGLNPIAGVITAALAGVAIGNIIEPTVSKVLADKTTATTDEGYTGDIVERLFFKLDMLLGGDTTSGYRTNAGTPGGTTKVEIDMKAPGLKAAVRPSRGPATGPGR